jgi:hypothetical protein
LLAQGGFEVSAERVSGVIQNVSITSTVGGSVHIANPWPETELKVVSHKTGEKVQTTRTDHGISFPTQSGESYKLAPASKP